MKQTRVVDKYSLKQLITVLRYIGTSAVPHLFSLHSSNSNATFLSLKKEENCGLLICLWTEDQPKSPDELSLIIEITEH